MKIKLLLFTLLIPTILLSQSESKTQLKTISGFVSLNNKALSNVNIFVENTPRYTTTDAKGFYNIKAKPGEIISYNYVGLKRESILIEDITKMLNIKMKPEKDILSLKYSKVLKLGEGSISDYATTFDIINIKGENLNKYASSLAKAIVEKTPELHLKLNKYGEEIIYLKGKELKGPAIWNFDGYNFNIPLPVFISEVKEVAIINQKYKGLTIVVNTNINYNNIRDIDYDNYFFSNNDYYQNDAILYKKLKKGQPSYLDKYEKIKNKEEALSLYLDNYSNEKNNINFHFNIINLFEKENYGSNNILKILADFEKFSKNNPEDLKAIAYKYQQLNENEKAIATYKKIIELRPNYKQSYRDLANVFLESKEYKSLWQTYHFYLKKGYLINDGKDISEIIVSEIISAYNKDSVKYAQRIKIENPEKNIESDVRIVFEWNTSEAEFILEFVNPNKETYSIENSQDVNNELITDHKENGYTSKEVFIKDLERGNWLVNFTYLGNKQYKPTFFKTTTYYNWGSVNESKKIDVFEFTIENLKTQLLKLNKRALR